MPRKNEEGIVIIATTNLSRFFLLRSNPCASTLRIQRSDRCGHSVTPAGSVEIYAFPGRGFERCYLTGEV
jgi:hypothetical protein